MKNIFIAFFIATGFFSAAVAQQPGDLNFLKQYNSKYAYEVKLFNNAVIKPRLQKLLGAQFNYFVKSIWQVETPIKVENNFVFAWAMQAHSGGDPSATLLADISKNILYLKIIKDNQTKIYSEDGSNAVPKELDDWAKKQSSQ
jgi:hypothetical protein